MNMASDPLTSRKWFTEVCPEGGSAFSIQIKEKIFEEQTPFQKLEIFETEFFGKLMTLDGLVMLTELDNFIYHEMLTHPALFTHPHPRRVAIIGGGDCGCLREVLRHSEVRSAELIEIDERVTRASERFFPELCQFNNDPRAVFHFTDGIQWMKKADVGNYDVVVVDSTDPVGLAAGLFDTEFYSDCYRALSDDGILIAQSESPLFHMEIIRTVRRNMGAAGFDHLATLNFPQCTYPSGWWTVTLASKRVAPESFRQMASSEKPLATRYYHSEIHRGALYPPDFIQSAFGD